MQTHPVFRPGILPADELRSRILEMSNLQVRTTISILTIWSIVELIPLFNIYSSKTALLEGLEIDQYLWGILNTLSSSISSDAEEVTIDSAANWRPVTNHLSKMLAAGGGGNIKTEDDGQSDICHSSKRVKVMSPGSVTLPTMPNWDLGQSLSPFCPPDMNSKEFIISKFILKLLVKNRLFIY